VRTDRHSKEMWGGAAASAVLTAHSAQLAVAGSRTAGCRQNMESTFYRGCALTSRPLRRRTPLHPPSENRARRVDIDIYALHVNHSSALSHRDPRAERFCDFR
jgi:hypothetical protein